MFHCSFNSLAGFGSVGRAALAAVLIATGSVAAVGAANVADLEGSWNGSGKIRYPSGETENARCRANFKKRGGGAGFSMTAVCATPSARVQQTATLSRAGPNRFTGEFENAEYGISGSIQITVNGDMLSASLNGGGGSASFSLSR